MGPENQDNRAHTFDALWCVLVWPFSCSHVTYTQLKCNLFNSDSFCCQRPDGQLADSGSGESVNKFRDSVTFWSHSTSENEMIDFKKQVFDSVHTVDVPS